MSEDMNDQEQDETVGPPVEGQEAPESPSDAPEDPVEGQDAPEASEEPEGNDTFDRKYVERLRAEAAKYRERAKGTDQLRQELWEARVQAHGGLEDPTDLPWSEGADTSPEAVEEAINALLERKPHLASRRPVGDAGQGAGRGVAAPQSDLLSIIRSRQGA